LSSPRLRPNNVAEQPKLRSTGRGRLTGRRLWTGLRRWHQSA
jgi:hypothetical protein